MDRTGLEIAVIGAAGMFPGASSLSVFWENLRHGKEAITFFSEEELRETGVPAGTIAAVDYVRAAGVLENYSQFDANLFNFDGKTATLIDPQQRVMLECCWHALEDAGYLADADAQPTGLFCAASPNTYFLSCVLPRLGSDKFDAFAAWTQNQTEHLPSAISRLLRLTGPSIAVEADSSSSLAAVHLACQSLLAGDSDLALAGGVCVLVPHKAGYRHQNGLGLSRDGHCRAFDSAACGTVPGSGAGVVVLKRLADAEGDRDSIYCIIRGTAINHDGGAERLCCSSPSTSRLAEVITRAQLLASVSPDTIRFVEGHGSGIVACDAAELAGLRQVFGKAGANLCAIGSVKTNIGHLHAAAGIASLIKTILALKHGLIPPTVHFRNPHPAIGLDDGPFYVNSQAEPWPGSDGARRAGVISVGRGGTNACVVLESVPGTEKNNEPYPERAQLLVVSALTDAAVEGSLTNLAALAENGCPGRLSDIGLTLQTGRKTLPHRAFVVCRNKRDLRSIKESAQRVLCAAPSAKRQVAFLLPGLGDHYVNMGRGLYESEPVFRKEIDYCADVLRPILELDLRDRLYPPNEDPSHELQPDFRSMVRGRNSVCGDTLHETVIAHPAVFAVEYALARMWMSWGVTPVALLGHSLGEYVAACLAGVFRLEDALQLVTQRARMIAQVGAGALLAVSMGPQEVQSLLGPGLWLSAHNGPELCTIAGSPQEVARLSVQITAAGVACRIVAAEHAFHSGMLEPVRTALESCVAAVPRRAPAIPYLSNATGQWVLPGEAIDPVHWGRHSCQTVRFAESLDALMEQPDLALLEVGPGNNLSALAQQHPAHDGRRAIVSSLRSRYESVDDREYALHALGKLWAAGVQPLWAALHEDEEAGRVSLPGYSFQRQHYELPLVETAVALEGILPFMLLAESTAGLRCRHFTLD